MSASLSRYPRWHSRRTLHPPRGLQPVSPQRVKDGASPGPDLDVAVLGQLSEPPVGSATVNEVLAAAAAAEISPLSRIASSNSRSRSSSESRTALPSPRAAIPLVSSPNAGKAIQK